MGMKLDRMEWPVDGALVGWESGVGGELLVKLGDSDDIFCGMTCNWGRGWAHGPLFYRY